MNIDLYEYGVENNLQEAEKLLRSALDNNNKHTKNQQIAEALGIVTAVRHIILIHENDEEEECDTLI